MKTYACIAFLSLVSTLFTSCGDGKQKELASSTAKDLFQAMRNNEESKTKQIYPGYENFTSIYKTDSVQVKSVVKRDSTYVVGLLNHFTNGMGKKTEKIISLVLRPIDEKSMLVVNSTGFTDYKEEDDYIIGLASGCIQKDDTLDQSILFGMSKAAKVKNEKAVDLYLELESECKVSDWTWESSYGGGAHGKGIVTNNSGYSIPKIQYVVTFKDRSGNAITTDEGYVTRDALGAGQSTSFSFYSSYVGNATQASIKLRFDDELLYKAVVKHPWTGSECSDYFSTHPEELTELEASHKE